jgi:hypothetical protein
MPRTIKRHDTYPPLTGTVTDANGNVPLGTPTEVKVIAKHSSGTPIKEFVADVVNPAATLPNDANCGKWTYEWVVGDTADAGEYSVEVQVTWSAGVVQTFPADSADNDTLTISADLDDGT